jgi:hypothetical protein
VIHARPGSPYRIGDRRTLRLRRSRTSCRAGANQSLEPSRSWRPLATMRATTATARCWQVPSEVGHLPPETKTSEGPNHVGATGDSVGTRWRPEIIRRSRELRPGELPSGAKACRLRRRVLGGLTRRWRSLRGGLRMARLMGRRHALQSLTAAGLIFLCAYTIGAVGLR